MNKFYDIKNLWENTIRPLAFDIMENATEDTENIHKFIGNLIYLVDYDIMHEQINNSMPAIYLVESVLSDNHYYENYHQSTSQDEITKMEDLAKLLNQILQLFEEEIQNDRQ